MNNLQLEKPQLQHEKHELGVYQVKDLPNEQFSELWRSIVLDEEVKQSLVCQCLLNITLRSQISRAVIPMHGIILLVGKPGTGKTSLAKGLASETAKMLPGQKVTYVEVEPHSLTGAAHGETQRAVIELFGKTIAGYANQGPTVVVIDEVESILVNRMKLSLDANPIDVHRATDAALVELDRLAEKYPNLLILATSNFPDAIDEAFTSRCDLVIQVSMPNTDACRQILMDALMGLSNTYPHVKDLIDSVEFETAARACVGLDGRQIRKVVAAACGFNMETARDPSRLTVMDILCAAGRAKGDVRYKR